jgi:H+/Cl- antiporter ClcA
MKPHHWPWTFLFFSFLGAVLTFAGIAALAGLFDNVHPLLADSMAGWGLIVSAIACFLSGAFPLVLRRLAERDDVLKTR